MTPLSQRSPKWSQITLGFGSAGQTIGGYGCTITCVAMLAGLTPDDVNSRLKAVGGFQGSYILWQKIHEAIPWLEFEWRGYSYNNDAVKAAITKNGACLVEVDFDGTERTDDRHWVLYIGGGKMYDPWTGTERSTGVYSTVLGYSVINVVGSQQGGNMDCILTNTDENKKLFEKLVHNSEIADAIVKTLGLADKADSIGVDTVQKSIAARDGKLTTCTNTLSTRETELQVSRQEVANREEQVSRLKDDLTKQQTLLNAEIIALKKQLESVPADCEKYKAAYEQEHSKFLAEAKEKGEVLNELAMANAMIKNLEESIDNDDRATVFKLLRRLLERIMGKDPS